MNRLLFNILTVLWVVVAVFGLAILLAEAALPSWVNTILGNIIGGGAGILLMSLWRTK